MTFAHFFQKFFPGTLIEKKRFVAADAGQLMPMPLMGQIVALAAVIGKIPPFQHMALRQSG